MDTELTSPTSPTSSAPPAPTSFAPAASDSPEPASGSSAEKKRVLVIDDEASFARMVKLNLEKTGQFEVRVENKATSAVAAAREFKPDLVLLDVIMPTMDGGDVANQIKRDRALKATPIIFLTATVSKREAGEGGFNSGGELFLAKPVSVELLIQRINERIHRPDRPAHVEP
jgi:CheY-like chemotaxis protein